METAKEPEFGEECCETVFSVIFMMKSLQLWLSYMEEGLKRPPPSLNVYGSREKDIEVGGGWLGRKREKRG